MSQRHCLFKVIKSSSYATLATKAQPKVPLLLHGLEGRYATALYTASIKTNELNEVKKDLGKISEMMQKNTNIQSFLENPTLKKDDKSKFVNELNKNSTAKTTKQFFIVLNENSRLSQLKKIIESFDQLVYAHKQEIVANVISVKSLSKDELGKIKTMLHSSKLTNQYKQIHLHNTINPTIKGGLIIEIGDNTIDASVASKISKIQKIMNDAMSL